MKLIFENLPTFVFKINNQVLNEHFTQWTAGNSLLCLITSEPPFGTLARVFLLDLPMPSETVTADFAKRQVHLPSPCDFLFSNANVEELG